MSSAFILLAVVCLAIAAPTSVHGFFSQTNGGSPPYPRTSAYTFLYRGTYYAYGGLGSASGTTLTYGFSSGDWGSTIQGFGDSPSNAQCARGALVSNQTQVRFWCGQTGTSFVNTVWTSTSAVPSPSTFTSSSAPWSPRADFQADLLAVPYDGQGTVIITGGRLQSGSATNDVWALTGGTYRQISGSDTYWSPRWGHSTATFADGTALILIGGMSGSTYYNDVWTLRINRGTAVSTGQDFYWAQTLPVAQFAARSAANAWVDNELIFLAAGALSASTVSNDVWTSADYGNSWTVVTLADNFPARSNAAIALAGYSIIMLGGQDASGNGLNDIWTAYRPV